MGSKKSGSLRSRIAWATALVTLLALVVAGALEGLTSLLHQSNTMIAESVQSIRAGDEAQLDLLLHARSQDPVVRRAYERDLRGKLTALRDQTSTGQEVGVLQAAEQAVAAYLQPGPADVGERHAAAFSALQEVVDVNVAQAAQAQRESARWERIASLINHAIIVVLLLVVVGLLLWLRTRAFQPLFALAQVMDRFGKGETDAVAPEVGSTELREMARRFNEMAQQLSAQRQQQMTFLGGVAHDLRNPLSALKTAVTLISPSKPLPPEPRLRRTLELVTRQIERLDRMIADLLDTARIEAGKLELSVAPCDLRQVVASVTELFELAMPGRQIEVSLPELEVAVTCDSLRMEQVLTNLVSNALKYSPQGQPVRVELAVRDAQAVVTVSDQGMGLSEEEQSHLFEPFRRVGPAKEMIPGVGLGLFTVRRIVEAHGGHIQVRSRRGQGSAFEVTLPAAQ